MRILVIEDEAKLNKLIRQVLEEEHYQVEQAYDGDTGLTMALSSNYDLIILDLMLPEMSGLEVCRFLRQERIVVPVLMLTARDAVHDRVQGLDAGADDYLTKPFAFEELLARVRALMRRQLSPQDLSKTVLKVADLELDPASHQAKRNNKSLDLTTKEFALLEYLMRHTGQALTREQIRDSVWEYDSEATSNVVDIYVHYLRAKVDEHTSRKLIKTVRGVGYSLRAD
ncbi:MAG TPA: response regulator transcription factor [Chloroflexia bacterium]|nr:response regulator transcription factor [Chloroflexia bacterium]